MEVVKISLIACINANNITKLLCSRTIPWKENDLVSFLQPLILQLLSSFSITSNFLRESKPSISMLEFQFPKSSSYFPLFLLLSPLYIQIYCCMYASLVIMHSLHHYMLKIKQNINRGKILTPHHMTLVTLQKGYDILGNWYLDNCIKNFSITWEDRIWSRFEIFKISHVRYKLIVIGILSIFCVHFKLNLYCKYFLGKTHFWSLQS